MAKYITNIVCIIFWSYCIAIAPLTRSNNETDVLALLAFQASITDPLGALNSWNKAKDYCSWNGITCGSKHPDRVVEINLMSQGLVGSLSPHVGNLSFLKKINLQNNTFNSKIPQEIGRLRHLKYVDLSNNSFIGEIPINVSQCPALGYLNLNGNSLSGSIPPELGSLLKLEQLGLGKNNLSGAIPPSLGNLTSLVQISLWVCNLEGEIPESFAQLQRLKFLTLPGNSLTGRIPPGLFNISTLIDFGVSSNKLEGVIPHNIDLTLPNLMGLYLGSNRFTGELPVSLSNITSLELISLEYNSFEGQIPKQLGRLPNLKMFITTGNHFQDDIRFIASFTNCTNLNTLEVGDNILRGTLPESMSNLSSQIYNLEISGTQIHGNIPPGIGNLVGLARLFLYDNNLEGPIPYSIGKLSNLEDLSLERNKCTNEIPDSFGNLTMLIHLTLQENNLSGSIPQGLGNCTSLLYLDISDNNLDGSIPPQIVSLPSISIFLLLSDNGFTGSIPDAVGSLTHLAYLDLSNNRLSGLVPNSIRACTSLQRLHLDGNLFQGEIPSALSSLKALQDLDLSRNNLSGKIPEFLSYLNLENLNLSFNMLNGEVPTHGVFGNKTALSVEGNKELCGGILELKLPPCSSSKSLKKHFPSSLKIIVPTLVAGGLCVALCTCIFIYIYRPKMTTKRSTLSLDGAQFMWLSYGDLLKATCGFSEDNLIGAGRFGTVFKGILDDGNTIVAIKVLNLFARGASKSFIAECVALKGIRHRNLLKLLSVCESIDFQMNEFKALVYEFMANGSLEESLYPKEQMSKNVPEFCGLDMLQRLKVAIDIAHALEYLHIGIDSPIIHGDLKPSNVLLDSDMTAHVGDFGLSKVVSSLLEAPESSTIGIRGTIGYVPPEYGTSNSVSMKGDVYSYGILLLEMFTGKRPTDQTFDESLNLQGFVLSALPNHATEIVDPFILKGHDMNKKTKECLASILSIGVGCSRNTPADRMCMTDVVHELCKIRDYYTAQD